MLNSTQYMRFLGGEVSPNLWNMADFDKYGKWFANAENIRFETLGAFKNRTGFIKVANTKNNLAGEKIKLLSFVFNNNESFMIELGKYYFRVFKDGKVITDAEGNPKVWNTNITFDEDEDVKYAQSGDTVFLATGKSPLYEIHRLEIDGSNWEIKEFKFLDDCHPVGEKNTDKTKIISAENQNQNNEITYSMLFDSNIVFPTLNFEITIEDYEGKSSSILNTKGISFSSWDEIKEYIIENGILFETTGLTIETNFSKTGFVFKKTKNDGKETPEYIYFKFGQNINEQKTYDLPYSENLSSSEFIKTQVYDFSNSFPKKLILPEEIREEFKTEEIYITKEELVTISNKTNSVQDKNDESFSLFSTKIQELTANRYSFIFIYQKPIVGIAVIDKIPLTLKFVDNEDNSRVLNGSLYGEYIQNTASLYAKKQESIKKTYKLTASDEIFKDKEIGDIVMVENYIEAGASSVSNLGTTNNAWRYGDIMKTDGAWSLTSMGNWAGTLVLEYSLTGESPWKPVTTIQSGSTSAGGNTDIMVSNNANQSGTVTAGDSKIIYMRVKAKITAAGTYKLTANAIGRTFTINSYYKILSKTDNKNCVVECVKNDIGEFKNAFAYSFGVFNKKDGYPTAIGFYQNRLILGKGYELWLSKSNDFWDFYEPISISKDDPINMSLLSYKVNTIKNIVSLRNFFVFSTGAEYGITSEGALSQDDKYLSTLSMHGSISARPIIIGNVVLFVDSSANTVRALRYTFESESYEAEDISIMQELMFKNKKFVTTELLQNEKECLFLDEDGTIWVLKFLPEQEILAWSHWKHAKHKITNLCVVQNGHKNDLYIAVDTENGKQIELMSDNIYLDSSETHYFSTKTNAVITDFPAREKVAVFADDNLYNLEVEENGTVNLPKEAQNVTIGLKYSAEATLLSPVTQVAEGVYTTYNRHKPFKTYFHYRDSYGFKVGAKEEEKMKIDFNLNERHKNPSSGKTSVLFVSKYDGSGQVSFKQEEPYQMNIENILLEVDYGGR